MRTIVSSLITRFLGDLVQFSSNDLDISLSSGELELRNLAFKPEALENLNLPITVKAGVLGRLHVTVPWTSLSTSSTVVTLEDIYVVAAPKENVFDDSFEKRQQETKERFLQMRELFMSKGDDDPAPEPKSESSSAVTSAASSWASRIVSTIINNLQVTVERVHIRYEDSVSLGSTFACGVSLSSLTALSCDEWFNTREAPAAASDAFIRKLCTLGRLHAYWDCDTEPLRFTSPDDLVNVMRAFTSDAQVPHQFILRPLSGTLRLQLQPLDGALNVDKNAPKMKITGSLQEVFLSLHECQMRELLALSEHFALEGRGAPYRKLRPKVPFRKDPKMWFRYCGECVLQDVRQRKKVWTWDWISRMITDRREYVRLWYLAKVRGGVTNLSQSEQDSLREMEKGMEYALIVEFRELGEALFQVRNAEANQAHQKAQSEQGWLGYLWGSATAERQRVLEQDASISGELVQQLNRNLAAKAPPALPQDEDDSAHPVAALLDFAIEKGSFQLNLYDAKERVASDLLTLEFDVLAVELRAVQGERTHINVSLGSLLLTENFSNPGQRSVVISRKRQISESLLDVTVVSNPAPGPKDFNMIITCRARPLDIFFAAPVVKRVIQLLTSAQSSMLDALLSQAAESARSVRAEAVRQIRGFVRDPNQSRMKLDIEIQAPIVTFNVQPLNRGRTDLILELGTVDFRTLDALPDMTTRLAEDGKTHVTAEFFYRQAFEISVRRVQAFVSGSGRKLIEDFSVMLQLRLLTFQTRMLPKVKLNGKCFPIAGMISPEDLEIVLLVVQQATGIAGGPSNQSSASKSPVITAGVSASAAAEESELEPEGLDTSSASVDDPSALYVFEGVSTSPNAMELSFELESLAVVLMQKDVDGSDLTFAGIKLDGIHLGFEQRRLTAENIASVKLNSLALEDRLHADTALLRGKSEPFLSLRYRGTPNSELGVDNDIDVETADMLVVVNRRTLLYALKFFQIVGAVTAADNIVQEGAEQIGRAPSPAQLVESKARPAGLQGAVQGVRQDQEQKEQADAGSSLVVVNMLLGSVKVSLCRANEPMMFAELERSKCILDMRKSGSLFIEGSVGRLMVTLPRLESRFAKWEEVVRPKSDATEVLQFTYEIHPRTAPDYSGADSKLELQLSSVIIVYEHSTLLSIMSYFNEIETMQESLFGAANAVLDLERAANEVLERSTVVSTGYRMVMSVTVCNPLIVLPRSSSSPEYVGLNLGQTTVMSRIEDDHEVQGEVQNMSLCINDIFGVHGDMTTGKERSLLNQTSIACFLRIPVSSPRISMSGAVTPVKFVLRPDQATLLVDLLTQFSNPHDTTVQGVVQAKLTEQEPGTDGVRVESGAAAAAGAGKVAPMDSSAALSQSAGSVEPKLNAIEESERVLGVDAADRLTVEDHAAAVKMAESDPGKGPGAPLPPAQRLMQSTNGEKAAAKKDEGGVDFEVTSFRLDDCQLELENVCNVELKMLYITLSVTSAHQEMLFSAGSLAIRDITSSASKNYPMLLTSELEENVSGGGGASRDMSKGKQEGGGGGPLFSSFSSSSTTLPLASLSASSSSSSLRAGLPLPPRADRSARKGLLEPVIRYSMADSEMLLTVARVRCVLLVPCLLELLRFQDAFMKQTPKLNAPDARTVDLKRKASPEKRRPPAVAKPNNNDDPPKLLQTQPEDAKEDDAEDLRPMEVRVVSKGLEVLLVEDVTSSRSDLMRVSLSASLALSQSVKQQRVDAEVNDLLITKSRAGQAASDDVNLTKPWKLGLNMRSTVGDEFHLQHVTRIDLLASRLEFILSRYDFFFFNRLYATYSPLWTTQLDPDLEKEDEDKQELSTTLTVEPASGDHKRLPSSASLPSAKGSSTLHLEPALRHQESSMLTALLQAEPIVLSKNHEVGLQAAGAGPLSLGPRGTSGEDSSRWVFDGFKVLLASDISLGLVCEEGEQAQNGSVVKVARIDDFPAGASDWIFYRGTIQMLRLFSNPSLCLIVQDGQLVLWNVSERKELWLIGDPMAPPSPRNVPKQPLDFSMIIANVMLEGVKVSVMDDSVEGHLQPVFRAKMKRLSVFFSGGVVGSMACVVQSNLAIDHFQSGLHEWEPVLRALVGTGVAGKESRFSFVLSIERNEFDRLRIELRALDPLSLVVTSSVLASAKQMAMVWSRSEEELHKLSAMSLKKVSASSRAIIQKGGGFRRYLIANNSGIPIRWSIGVDTPHGLETGEVAPWEDPLKSIDMSRNETDPELGRRTFGFENTLSVFLGDSATPFLRHLPINGVRVHCFSGEDRSKVLVYEVRHELGTSILEVRTNFRILSNLNSFALRVFESGKEIGSVAPRDMFCIPLDKTGGLVAFGPEDKDTTAFSIASLADAAEVSVLGVLRHSLTARSGNQFFSLLVQGTPDILTDNKTWDITVSPTLRIRNLLHVKIMYMVFGSDQDTKLAEGEVERGQDAELFTNPEEVQYLTIRFGDKNNYFDTWSPLVSVTGEQPARKMTFAAEMPVDVTMEYHFEEGQGTLLSLWIPYWVVNKSSLDFSASQRFRMKQRAPRGQVDPPPVLFSGKQISLDVVAGEEVIHVQPVDVETAASHGVITAQTAKNMYEFGVRILSAPSKYWRTKIVQFDDRYVLVNMTDHKLSINQVGTNHEICLEPNSQVPFFWKIAHPVEDASGPDAKRRHQDAAVLTEKLVRIKVSEDGWRWSGAFELREVALFNIVTSRKDVRARITVQCTTDMPVTAVILRPATKFSIYRLRNSTRTPIIIRQQGVADEGEWVSSREEVAYAWPEPSRKEPKVVLTFPRASRVDRGDGSSGEKEENGGLSYSIDTAEIYRPFAVTVHNRRMMVRVRLFFKGPTKIFEVSEVGVMTQRLGQDAGLLNTAASGAKTLGGEALNLVTKGSLASRPKHSGQGLQGTRGDTSSKIDPDTEFKPITSTTNADVEGNKNNNNSNNNNNVTDFPTKDKGENSAPVSVSSTSTASNGAVAASADDDEDVGESKSQLLSDRLGLVNVVSTTMALNLTGILISVVGDKGKEVMVATIGQTSAMYEEGDIEATMEVNIKRFQVDNMLSNTPFPIVFWPRNPHDKPFLHFAVNQAKGYSGLTFFNGIEFVMQEADLRVDEAFVTHLYLAVEHLLDVDHEEDVDFDRPGGISVEVRDFREVAFSISDMVYCRTLYIGPVSVGFSYSSCSWAAVQIQGDIGSKIQGTLSYFNEIDYVHVDLGMLNLDDAYHSRKDLTWQIVLHYKHQVMVRFFTFLGAVPVLGAPVEMFRGITSGVKEVFFAPAQGIMRSPADFGEGLRRGSSALFKGTVGAFFREVGKVTTTGARLAAKATFDHDYQLQRAKAAKVQAKSAGEGFKFAARDFGRGFLGGLSGVIMNPIKGAQKEGIGGFGKGIGTGLLGVVVKPVVGALDAMSQVSNGLKNAHRDNMTRMRRPRQHTINGAVQEFSGYLAESQEVLQVIDNSRHALSMAVWFYPELGCIDRNAKGKFVPREEHVMISNKAIFLLQGHDITSLTMSWRVTLKEVGELKLGFKNTSVLIVQHAARKIVREIKLWTIEEAFMVYRKIFAACEEEREVLAMKATGN